ncbi:hypothetical protein ACFSYB_11395 [Litchfieldia salsa]
MSWGENEKAEDISAAMKWIDYIVQDFNLISNRNAEQVFIHNKEEDIVPYIYPIMDLYAMNVKDL